MRKYSLGASYKLHTNGLFYLVQIKAPVLPVTYQSNCIQLSLVSLKHLLVLTYPRDPQKHHWSPFWYDGPCMSPCISPWVAAASSSHRKLPASPMETWEHRIRRLYIDQCNTRLAFGVCMYKKSVDRLLPQKRPQFSVLVVNC